MLDGHDVNERADSVQIRTTVKGKRTLIDIPGIFYCPTHKATFKIVKRKDNQQQLLDLMVILDLKDEGTIKDLKPRTDLEKNIDVHYPFTR